MSSPNIKLTDEQKADQISQLEHKLRIASSRLMLSNFTKLISIVLYRFKLIIDDSDLLPPGGLACVLWDEKDLETPIPQMYFKPELCTWSESELAFVIVHEILHTLDKHASRRGTKEPQLWNLACDHVINSRIKQDIQNGNKILSLPECCYIIKELNEPNITAEEAYAYLIKHPPQLRPGGEGSGEGKTQVRNDGDWKDINEDLNDANKGQSPQEAGEINDMKGSIEVAMDSEPFKSLSKQRGDQTGGITEYLKSIIEVEIPWEDLLDKAIKTNVRVISENRSWRMPNKRMRSHNLMIPSRSNDDESKSNLYILADHSASVSTGDLKKMASLIMQSIAFFERIIIIKHDTQIVGTEEVSVSSDEDQIKEAISGKGRGGTNHHCVFREIQDRLDSDEDEEDIGLILILTDYESNIDSIWKQYKWTSKIPAKIILTQRIAVSPEVDPDPILLLPKV